MPAHTTVEFPAVPTVGEYIRTTRDRNGLSAGMEGRLIGLQAESFCMVAFDEGSNNNLHDCWMGGTEEACARAYGFNPTSKRFYFCYISDIEQITINGKRVVPKDKVCYICHKTLPRTAHRYADSKKHCICEDCMSTKSYSTKNDTKFGKPTRSGYTFGFEFECVPKSPVAKVDLITSRYQLKATSDASLNSVNGIEYKSPTMMSKRSLKPMFKFVYDNADLSSRYCGQHINMGNSTWLNRETMNLIRSKADYLFLPLENYFDAHPDEQKLVCGRGFGQYCAHSEGVWRHGRWLNLDHDNRFEFRIAKFVTPEQYYNQVNMWEEVMDVVHTAVQHNPRQPRQWKAYGNKIVAVFQKYANEAKKAA